MWLKNGDARPNVKSFKVVIPSVTISCLGSADTPRVIRINCGHSKAMVTVEGLFLRTS